MQKITPFLWYASEAEAAANYYTSIFPNSKIHGTTRYGKEGREIHGREPGSVMTVDFELAGQRFTAINGGPIFKFSEAISFVVHCETQDELDHYWDKLSAGGDATAQQCGWLKDRFGVSWQIVPTILTNLLSESDPVKSGQVMRALLQMKKLNIEALQQAASA
jgi:predicted 3-demethylubiquinone-9 3-methyltransferase (glyoxalase superfamily)